VRNDVLYFYTLEQVKIYSTKFVSKFYVFHSFSYEYLNTTESFELNQKILKPKEKLNTPTGWIHAMAQTTPQAEIVASDPLGPMATCLPTGLPQGWKALAL
jgi:hypothetical protein